MDIAAYCHEQLKAAGHPVESIVLPVGGDRNTWRVILIAGSTAQQQTAANAALAALVIPNAAAQVNADALARLDAEKMVKALAIATAKRFGITVATFRGEVIAEYKIL